MVFQIFGILLFFSVVQGQFYSTGPLATTGGNANGALCVFPFVYRGKTYEYCTTDNWWPRHPWCATVSNYDIKPEWGYCPTSGIVAVGGNLESECVFPFVYKEKSYFSCTDKDRDRPWCSLTDNYDVDEKWAYCASGDIPEIGGNADGDPCVFPFIYHGKSYNKCVADWKEGGSWCATTSNYDEDKKWSTCPSSPVATTEEHSDGAPCVFPFIYHGTTYYHCTTDKWWPWREYPWCATVSNYDINPKWGYCSTSGIRTFGGNAEVDCFFPFIYKGEQYSSCIKGDKSKYWCSVTSDYDVDKQWGYCDGYDTPE
ncbi:epididymal sperm-binding protein 1-like [Polyodon spathula]|uniref:epididymal sperm-binding protein 1-like n=1 Tax=Polyodon spathula TaxID=7913 RepID=UPI001B7E6DCC|nr:epididymal sperm-binding protein 1-like [Polyodon spathula]